MTHLQTRSPSRPTAQPSPIADPLLRMRPVLEATGIPCKSTVYAMMARGEFPRPVRIGARAVAWRASAIDEWIASRPTVGNE